MSNSWRSREGNWPNKLLKDKSSTLRNVRFARGSDIACQALAGEIEHRDAPWSRLSAYDIHPPTIVDAGVPRAQGSIRIVGNALLEIKQRVQIRGVLMNAMDVSNSIAQK